MVDDLGQDGTFEGLLKELSPEQLDWVRVRMEPGVKSDAEACRRLDVNKNTPSNWRKAGVPIDEIVHAARSDGVILVRERIRRDLNRAYDVKREGLGSDSEKVRQETASEILDRGIGKATQRQETELRGGSELTVRFFNPQEEAAV